MWINDMTRGRARRKFGLFAVVGLTASAFALIYFGPSASADPGGEPLPGSVTTQLMGSHDLSATAEPGISTTTKLIKEAPPLPKDAAAQAELQETVDAAADKVDAIASTEAGAGYAGSSVDIADQQVDVWWKGKAPQDLLDLIASYPAGVAIVLHAAEFTQSELQTALNRVMTSKLEDQPLLKDGVSINSGSPATDGPRLEIEYTNDGTLSAGEIVQRLQGLTGVPVTASVGQQVVPLTGAINRWNDVHPWYGGAGYLLDNTTICTTGVPVVHSGHYDMLTAGHCFEDGTEVASTQAGTVISTGNGLGIDRDWDSRLMTDLTGTAPQNGPYIYVNLPESSTSMAIGGTALSHNGDNVCTDGANSGGHCTLIVQKNDTAWYVLGYLIHGISANNPAIGLAVAQGDSGGPVIVQRTDGKATIRGVISAGSSAVTCPVGLLEYPGNSCFHSVYYVGIGDLMTLWAVTVPTVP